MKIEYLNRYPEYTEVVSTWIYNEFVNETSDIKLEEIIEFLKNNKTDTFPITFVAIKNKECLGTISIFENDLKTQNELKPWLASLYVAPNHRGKGIANLLIENVLKKVKKMNYFHLYLRTEHTAEYYKKRGWSFLYKATDEKNQETEVYKYLLI